MLMLLVFEESGRFANCKCFTW